jgi:hypothetical protein
MRRGPLLATLGAALFLVGLGALNPLLRGATDGWVVALFELERAERLIAGGALPLPQAAGLLALLAVAALVASGRRGRRTVRARRLATAGAALATAVALATAWTHATGAQTLAAAAAAASALAPDEAIRPQAGFVFLWGGAAALLAGALLASADRRRFRPDERFLRVALLWNGAVVRERVLTTPADVLIGEDADCDFVLPTGDLPALPPRLTLFRADEWGRYALALVPGFRGALTVQALAGRADHPPDAPLFGGPSPAGVVHVPLDEDDWGIFQVGDLSLWFQFVGPPERVPGRIADRLPLDLMGTTALSAVLQVAVLLAALFLWQEQAVRALPSPPRAVPVTVKPAEPPRTDALDSPAPFTPARPEPTRPGPTRSGPTRSGPTRSGPTRSGPAAPGA